MSHSKERHEKICLNCNTEVVGRYCHVCGQENIEPKETVWGLISHFFYDITHFDGKFFSTLRYLITRPGFLSKEYIAGRRARYLHPIRMYVFTSALFFLVFFSMYDAEHLNIRDKGKPLTSSVTTDEWEKARLDALGNARSREDSLEMDKFFNRMRPMVFNEPGKKARVTVRSDSAVKKGSGSGPNVNISGFDDLGYQTTEDYDSAQKLLPASERDNWFKRKMQYRSIEIRKKYHNDKNGFTRALINKFLHTFPYLLFVSLPLYALFLRLLYIRRKQFYYVNHGLFMIHLYIFTFIFLLVLFGLDALRRSIDISIGLGWLEFLLILAGIYYAYKAMRVFYGQSRLKTLTKFMILNLLAFVSIVILFVIFFVFTVFRV